MYSCMYVCKYVCMYMACFRGPVVNRYTPYGASFVLHFVYINDVLSVLLSSTLTTTKMSHHKTTFKNVLIDSSSWLGTFRQSAIC